ncbi:MAG: hypothetical protein AAFR90_08605 [Pseudomonadota bacterium]
MTEQTAIAQLVATVAEEVAEGSLGGASQQALEVIGRSPAVTVELLDLMIKEGAKEKADDNIVSTYGFLLGHALEQVRYDVDRGSPDGIALAEELRQSLLDAGTSEHVSPSLMQLLLTLFANAKLEMGDELRNLMQRMIEADNETDAAIEPDDWRKHLAQLVEGFDGDVFVIHSFLEDSLATMPEDMRANFLTAAFFQGEPALREAIAGFLCSEWSSVRFKIAEILQSTASQGLVSPVMLRRMIAMRNWLPAEQRNALDRSIKTCRQSGVECASWPTTEHGRVLATAVDGAGGLSILCILPDGHDHKVAGMFGKLDAGIRDCWVKPGVCQAELEDIEARFLADAPLQPAAFSYATDVTRYLLGVNVKAGRLPPFSLLGFAEAIGLDEINPIAMPVDHLVETLINAIPEEQLTPTAIDTAVSESGEWLDQCPMLESWFEDSEEVRQRLAKRTSRKNKITWLLSGPLQQQRHFWAQLVAWTAFGIQKNADGSDWQSLSIVAREILQDRPLDEIPLMHEIAATTVDIHQSDAA